MNYVLNLYVRRALWLAWLLVVLLVPRPAYADNCGGLADCYGQIAAAVLVALLIALLILVLLEVAAAAAAAAAEAEAVAAAAAAAEAEAVAAAEAEAVAAAEAEAAAAAEAEAAAAEAAEAGEAAAPRPPTPPADSAQPPGEGWQWRGDPRSPVGGDKGAWYNPETGETLHPDLGHPEPIGPHWDYRAPDGSFWRIFPDGTILPK